MAAIGKGRELRQKPRRNDSGVRERPPRREPNGQSAGDRIWDRSLEASHDSTGDEASRDRAIQDDAALIGRLLDGTSRRLAQMPDTPLKRELRLVVDRYRRALGDWLAQRPTPVQRTVLLDCVKALHDRIASRSTKDAAS